MYTKNCLEELRKEFHCYRTKQQQIETTCARYSQAPSRTFLMMPNRMTQVSILFGHWIDSSLVFLSLVHNKIFHLEPYIISNP